MLRRHYIVRLLPGALLLGCIAAILAVMGSAGQVAHAQAPGSQVCRATMVLDRSGSIDPTELERMRSQIRRLFEPTGLYNDAIHLAFWTFASEPGNSNYNAPFHDFVSSRGLNSSFNSRLSAITSGGGTNYQQGFGYNGDVRNVALNDTIEASDILVFMTDGEPNQPAGGLVGGISPEESGRQAAIKHLNAGRAIIGGSIGNGDAQRRVINYVVSGDHGNYNNTFFISGSFNDLALKLKEQIDKKCKELFPPCIYNPALLASSPDCKPPEDTPYSLTPSVVATSTVISGADSAGFVYKINNDSLSATSKQTSWSVKRLVIDRGQPVDALYFTGGEAFRDNYSCAALLGLVAGKGTCSESGAAGTRTFAPGSTTLSSIELGPVGITTVDDSWQVGTKLCYVFSLDKPTQNPSPANRYGRASCVVVGKRPTTHVYGGDVTAGRYFKADDIKNAHSPNIRGSITSKVGNVNKTFGSWAEYGVFTPGVVSGFASASGLAEGYDGSVTTSQDAWSTLTFANELGEYGKFTNPGGLGRVTDMAEYFLRGRQPDKDLEDATTVGIKGGDAQSGVYQKLNGDLRIDESLLERSKEIIIYVPNGTVTVTGNIAYAGGEYHAIKELPQMVIIAKNIVINGGVTNIDAWLIAQDGTGMGGSVATCEAMGQLTSEICNAPLRINGLVMAKQLQLRRTGGSGVGAASGDPAEVINLRADAYLWAFKEGKSSVRALTTNTIELPPQF